MKRIPDHANVEPRRAYSACITFMDRQVGRVLDSMDSLGLSNDTLALFFSDHGLGVGEGGHWGKNSLYEIDTRVPLIIRDPKIPQSRGVRTPVVVELIDLWKTIVDLGELPFANDGRDYYVHRDGRSLRGILQDPGGCRTSFEYGSHIAVTVMPKLRSTLGTPFSSPGKSHTWTAATVIGFAARDRRYRYVAWMPFNKTLDAVDWSLAPLDEELYEYHTAVADTFDDWDRQQLLLDRNSTSYGGFRQTVNGMLTKLRVRARARLDSAWGSYPWRQWSPGFRGPPKPG